MIFKSRTAGFSLSEVMIAAGILGIVALAIATFMRQFTDSRTAINDIAIRDGIAARIRQQIVLPLTLQLSRPLNPALEACLDNDPGTLCLAKRRLPLRLRSAGGGAGAAAILADGNLNGGQCSVVYGRRGERNCDPAADPGCPSWHACAWFVASCPNPRDATCATAAASIAVLHQVVPGAVLRNNRGRIDQSTWNQPDAEAGNFSGLRRAFPRFPRRAAETVDVRLGLLRERQQCNPFAVIERINADGTVRCVCKRGHIPSDTSDNPTCTPAPCQCNEGERFGGFDAQGRILCYPLQILSFPVPDAEIDAGVANCDLSIAPDGCDQSADPWIISLNLGVCENNLPPSKKPSTDEVQCRNRDVQCGCYSIVKTPPPTPRACG